MRFLPRLCLNLVRQLPRQRNVLEIFDKAFKKPTLCSSVKFVCTHRFGARHVRDRLVKTQAHGTAGRV